MNTKDKQVCVDIKKCWEDLAEGFFILKNLEKDRGFKVFAKILEAIIEKDVNKAIYHYKKLFYLLAAYTENARGVIVGDAWQNYLLDRLIKDLNTFSVKASQAPLAFMGNSLRRAFQEDLCLLERFFQLDSKKIIGAIHGIVKEKKGKEIISLKELASLSAHLNKIPDEKDFYKLKLFFFNLKDWHKALKVLADYYYKNGAGFWGEYWAFRWEVINGKGKLRGLPILTP